MASAQGRVHPVAVGGVQHDAPVTELVAEPLDDQGPVVGGRARVAGPADRRGMTRGSPPRSRVEPARGQRRDGRLLRQGGKLAHPWRRGPCRARRAAPGVSPCQNGSLPGCPGAGSTSNPVGRDVLDPPRRGAEHEHVADPATRTTISSSSFADPAVAQRAAWSAAGRNTPK